MFAEPGNVARGESFVRIFVDWNAEVKSEGPDVSDFSKMDKPFAGIPAGGCDIARRRFDCRCLVLSHAEVFARGLQANTTGPILTCHARGTTRGRLSLLSFGC